MAKRDRELGVTNPEPKEWTADELSLGYVSDYKKYNMVDGEGVRCSLYVSGCPFACKGCYNVASQNFHYGKPYTQELEDEIIEDLSADYCQGMTFLGGEPMLNTNVTIPLAERIREEYGSTKDIWSWTGYTWEELQEETEDKLRFLNLIDVLVDGRFLLIEMDLTKQFRGSTNQRIIDVQESLKVGEVVLWKNSDGTPYK